MWRLAVFLLGLWPAVIRAQCPTVAQRYQRLTELSALSTPGQIIIEVSQLEKQLRACRVNTDSVYAKTLHVLGRSYWRVGKLDTAILLTKRAIAINGLNRSDVRKANMVHSYYNLGRIYGDKADYQLAVQSYTDAVNIAKQYPEKWASGASACAEKAFIYYNIGDYEKAANTSQEGFYLSQRANDRQMSANTLVQLAQALIALNDLSNAEESLQNALRFTWQTGDLKNVANVYSLLAVVADKQQRNQQAIQYYHQAFEFNKRANFRYGCTQSLDNLGFSYAKMGQYDKALSIYKQALVYCDDLGSKLSLLNSMGKSRHGLKLYPKALRYYQQALQLIDPSLESTLFVNNPDSRFFKMAAHKEYLLALIQDKADAWLDYAKATNNRQRLKYALATYKVADQMIDFMRWEHTGNLSKLYWREKTRGLYERAIETCHLLNDTAQAFRFFEKSRAVMLADKLNELGARQKLAQNQIDKENELRKAVNDQQAQLAVMSPDSDSYKSARMELFDKQERLDAFLKQLEISNPDYFRYKYDTTITTLADLRSRLNTQKASFVTYFVGDSALYVLGVTTDGVKVLRQPVRGYKQAMNDFMSLLWKPEAMNLKANFDIFLRSGYGLYQRLLAPLNLPVGRVIVSPDGSFVPFETLSRKAGTPDYLLNDYAFSYTYSARSLLKKSNNNLARHGFNQLDFLGVAPVDFAPSLKQVMLPGSDTALASIAQRFKSSRLLTHGAATRRDFLEQAADARVIHLFTHATADSSDQDEPKLYFADATLKLSELSDRTLPQAQLVVLAACKTGIGAIQRGEGVFSLARGFAALGVPSVLTTLWSVQNDATYQLTNLFYKHLDEGLPKDIALQLAKKEWLETADGANRLPNYWAGLIVVGDAEPLPRLPLALWASFLVLLLVAAGVIVWHERRQRQITRPVSLPQPV